MPAEDLERRILELEQKVALLNQVAVDYGIEFQRIISIFYSHHLAMRSVAREDAKWKGELAGANEELAEMQESIDKTWEQLGMKP